MSNALVAVSNLSVNSAPLPQTYEHAKLALSECNRIDECQSWANKAEALASYARQADDDTLRKLADRIQARAVRRAGELLKQFDGKGRNQYSEDNNGTVVTQKQAAEQAGMSQRQKETAVRVANVPEGVFEAAVESESPPTVTKLAEQGKKHRPKSEKPEYADKPGLGGPVPDGFQEATTLLGTLARFAEFCAKNGPEHIANGLLPKETEKVRQHIAIIDTWLDKLVVSLPGREGK